MMFMPCALFTAPACYKCKAQFSRYICVIFLRQPIRHYVSIVDGYVKQRKSNKYVFVVVLEHEDKLVCFSGKVVTDLVSQSITKSGRALYADWRNIGELLFL